MEAANPQRVQVVRGNAKFARKFYEILSQDKENVDKNLFFSPLSAHTILALTYQGAGGKTAKVFAKILCVPNKDVAAKGYNSVLNSLNHIEKVTLLVANKIFVKSDFFPLKEKFVKTASELFFSKGQLLNFENNVESAAVINNWVEEKTNSKMKDAIAPESLNEYTRLVLVNAIYFKSDWLYPFNESKTQIKPFYISKDEKMDCSMMQIKEVFSFSINRDLDAKILELPYFNRDISMVVILPNKIDGIVDLEKKLVNVDLSAITHGMRRFEVQLSLPKFKIETTMNLKSVLNAMGLGIIFNEKLCDLTEISDSCEPLFVTEVIQQAFIEVNEEGTEAAAVSRLLVGGGAVTTEYFNADHPFVIYLQTREGIVLFNGRIAKPVFK